MHGALGFVDGPALSVSELARWQITSDHEDMTEGSIAEYCPAAEPIMRQLAGRIARHGGACLIIDYGKNDNFSDSLQAVSTHKPVDLFYQPGNAIFPIGLILRHYAGRLLMQAHGSLARSHRQIFLWQGGLRERAENAARLCDASGRRALFAAVDRLVGAHHGYCL